MSMQALDLVQVQICQSPTTSQDIGDEERFGNAMAFLCTGFSSRNPSQVETALHILQGLGEKVEPATGR